MGRAIQRYGLMSPSPIQFKYLPQHFFSRFFFNISESDRQKSVKISVVSNFKLYHRLAVQLKKYKDKEKYLFT